MPNFSEIFYAVVAYLIKQYDLVYVLVFLDGMGCDGHEEVIKGVDLGCGLRRVLVGVQV